MIRTPSFLRDARVHAMVVALALTACATTSSPGAKLLAEADKKLAGDDYAGAIASYSSFLNASPQDPQAARARATKKALEQLLAAQAALARTQQGSDANRRELAEKQAEAERSRAEADRLRGEVAKLRTDLDRLRSIDLAPARGK